MTPRSALLSALVLLSFLCTVPSNPTCNNECCRFVEDFPVRLRKLRENNSHIRGYYEANDDLDTALLDQSVEESFRIPFACHAMNSILEFYLDTVLPTALAGVTTDIQDLKPHMESIQQIFDRLKSDVIRCIAGDSDIAVKLLDKSLIKNVQDGQTCCFVRLVLRFYVERVFSNYASAQAQDQRSSSALANAFVSIRKDIHKCHCQCAEDTQRKVDSLHAEFNKLEINQAARKAVGELDTVLEWLEGLGQKTLR